MVSCNRQPCLALISWTILGSIKSMTIQAFGEYLQSLIDARGLTKYRLAQLSGVNETLLGKIVRGDRNATDDILNKIGPHLGVSYDELRARVDFDHLGLEGVDRLRKYVLNSLDVDSVGAGTREPNQAGQDPAFDSIEAERVIEEIRAKAPFLDLFGQELVRSNSFKTLRAADLANQGPRLRRLTIFEREVMVLLEEIGAWLPEFDDTAVWTKTRGERSELFQRAIEVLRLSLNKSENAHILRRDGLAFELLEDDQLFRPGSEKPSPYSSCVHCGVGFEYPATVEEKALMTEALRLGVWAQRLDFPWFFGNHPDDRTSEFEYLRDAIEDAKAYYKRTGTKPRGFQMDPEREEYKHLPEPPSATELMIIRSLHAMGDPELSPKLGAPIWYKSSDERQKRLDQLLAQQHIKEVAG